MIPRIVVPIKVALTPIGRFLLGIVVGIIVFGIRVLIIVSPLITSLLASLLLLLKDQPGHINKSTMIMQVNNAGGIMVGGAYMALGSQTLGVLVMT